MELYTRIYYHHKDPHIMQTVDQLFTEVKGDEAKWIALATQLNAQHGAELAQDLIDQMDSLEYDAGAESLEHHAGYSIVSFTHGSSGDEWLELLLNLLRNLVQDITAQGYGTGDEDPWEFWMKFEGDELIRHDNEPFNDEEEDEHTKQTLYTWWHADLPDSIKVGYLNEDQDDE